MYAKTWPMSFVFSFLPLLFASTSLSLSLSLCLFAACVCLTSLLATCLYLLSTSDLQMNCMLRSWSTRPLVRSWTMPSMTWHLCRCSASLFPLPVSLQMTGLSVFPSVDCMCLLPLSANKVIKTFAVYICVLVDLKAIKVIFFKISDWRVFSDV